jgi:hypothetical protein
MEIEGELILLLLVNYIHYDSFLFVSEVSCFYAQFKLTTSSVKLIGQKYVGLSSAGHALLFCLGAFVQIRFALAVSCSFLDLKIRAFAFALPRSFFFALLVFHMHVRLFLSTNTYLAINICIYICGGRQRGSEWGEFRQ